MDVLGQEAMVVTLKDQIQY